MYIKRHLEQKIHEMSHSFPVILLTGPRQVGKTTMLRKVAGEFRTYISLDDPMARDLAKRDPGLFLQRFKPPVLIDEIQYAPELFPYIKLFVDEHKDKGAFWLTGSQMFHLMKGVGESLAGRVGIVPMSGLSTSEIAVNENLPFTTDPTALRQKVNIATNVRQIYKRIYKGSMPALYETEQDIENYYSSYVDTYLQRDIRDLTQVGDELSFMRFMQACAARTGQMVNYSELAKDVGISSPTAKQWLSIMRTSGIVFLLEPYFNNALKRIIKAPKIYFMDTGLCAYLTRWTNPESLEVSAMSGAFFETYIISEIIKSYYNSGKRPPIYYYRDKDKKEIDLLLDQNGILSPVEIKKTANPKRDSARHFQVLDKPELKRGQGAVICMCNDRIPIDNRNSFIPAGLI